MRAHASAAVALASVLAVLLGGCGGGTDAEDGDRGAAPSSTAGDDPDGPTAEPTDSTVRPAQAARRLREAIEGPATARVDLDISSADGISATGTAGFGGEGPVLDLRLDFRTVEADGTYRVEVGAFALEAPAETGLPASGSAGYPAPWGPLLALGDPAFLAYLFESHGRSAEVDESSSGTTGYTVAVRPEGVLGSLGVDPSSIDRVDLPREWYLTFSLAPDGTLDAVGSDLDLYGSAVTTFDRWR